MDASQQNQDMDSIVHMLPSKQAQSSAMGIKIGRKQIANERREAIQRRRSTKMNQIQPLDPTLSQELKKRGIMIGRVETEEDQYMAMKLVRAMPRPMAVKRSIRDLLLAGKVVESKGFRHDMKLRWKNWKMTWNDFLYSTEVWRGSLKSIEGQQGTGVVSYFVFLRWLFFLNIFIFLLLFWVVVFFQIAFSVSDYDEDTLGNGDPISYSTGATLADTCTSQYSANVTYEALYLFLDFIQGTGWMETTSMFYGYYSNQETSLAVTEYNMPLAYFLTTIIVLLASLIVMVRNTISNFKESILVEENSKKGRYCNSVFAAWDYTIAEAEGCEIKQKSVNYSLCSDLAEQRYENERQSRTSSEKCQIYTIRFFINVLILIMLGGAGAAIYYAQDFSSDFTNGSQAKEVHALVLLLVEFLPSIVIGLLNGIYPLIFEILVGFEKYRPAFVIKISLIRIVFLRLASLAMLVVTLYVNITCSNQDSCLVGQGSCPAIQCWETYVGSSIYKLLVLDFFIDAGMILGVELPRKLITTKCECGLLQKIGPAVFDIPKCVLDLVYAQALCWMGFFFAPLLPAICVFRFFVLFYLKKLSALYTTIPAEKPYQASRSNTFFMIILMVTFAMICVPVGFVLVAMDPSPMCGPFRIYDYPTDIVTLSVDMAADGFQTFWNIITSSAFISAVIIILALAVYYMVALNSAHKELADMMREQLILEGRDKQFLLARINELTGGKQTKRPPPQSRPPRQQMNVENETKKQNGNLGVESDQFLSDLYRHPATYIEAELPAPAHYEPEQVATLPHYESPNTNFRLTNETPKNAPDYLSPHPDADHFPPISAPKDSASSPGENKSSAVSDW